MIDSLINQWLIISQSNTIHFTKSLCSPIFSPLLPHFSLFSFIHRLLLSPSSRLSQRRTDLRTTSISFSHAKTLHFLYYLLSVFCFVSSPNITEWNLSIILNAGIFTSRQCYQSVLKTKINKILLSKT